MAREDFHSTDLEGAAYYAGIYGDAFDLAGERPSRVEAEADCDFGLVVSLVFGKDTGNQDGART